MDYPELKLTEEDLKEIDESIKRNDEERMEFVKKYAEWLKKTKMITKDIEYVELYAEELINNPKLFEQQRVFIESQMKASKELFLNKFGENFNEGARKYLKERDLI
ncbi:MAG: hypothetical protein KJ939_02700 [Nanoarchaeota archaeon]|nr:hypothetical protein [Nanoarchaeota archaeon]